MRGYISIVCSWPLDGRGRSREMADESAEPNRPGVDE